MFGIGTTGNLQKSALPVGPFISKAILCTVADSIHQ